MPADPTAQAAPTGEVAELRRSIRLQSGQAVATSLVLAQQLRVVEDTTEAVLAHSHELRRQRWINRARLQAAWRQCRGDGDGRLTWFVIHGLIDGRAVWGSWAAGELRCDPLLEARARLLVDLEESFVFEDPPRCLAASLEHPPVAVALTLIRACDRPLAVNLSSPDALG